MQLKGHVSRRVAYSSICLLAAAQHMAMATIATRLGGRVRLGPTAVGRAALVAPTRIVAASYSILLPRRNSLEQGPPQRELDWRAAGGLGEATGARGAMRWCSTEAESKPTSPKIEALVDEIAALSLLEAAELTEALKVRMLARCHGVAA